MINSQTIPTEFKKFTHNNESPIPIDIELILPPNNLPLSDQHFLLEIPWEEKYLALVPAEFLNFFKQALPYLHVRTTDVHTAICLSIMPGFINRFPIHEYALINQRVIALALILHDSGWSKLSQEEIASSLGVTGLTLSSKALAPKEKHAVESEKIARSLLTPKTCQPPLTLEEINLICRAVLLHDKPEAVAGTSTPIPLEVQILVDLDHIWSFTHQNFWQDTIRKGVDPQTYLNNLSRDIESYFVTKVGKELAREYLTERSKEVDIWKLL